MSRRADATNTAVSTRDLGVAHAGGSRPGEGRAVDGVTIDVPVGGALVVMGPTGSGKSSLLAVLAGDDSGDVSVVGGEGWVHGMSLRKRGRTRRLLNYHVGHHRQAAGADLPPRLTVGEIIAEPITSRDRKVNPRALALRSAALLDELRLPLGLAAKYPYELSAGMRQRVAFARALVLQPKVLVADEPLANLDPEVRPAVLDAIRRRRDAYGMTTVIATNEPDVAAALDAEVLVLQHGHPVAQGRHDAIRWSLSADADTRLAVS